MLIISAVRLKCNVVFCTIFYRKRPLLGNFFVNTGLEIRWRNIPAEPLKLRLFSWREPPAAPVAAVGSRSLPRRGIRSLGFRVPEPPKRVRDGGCELPDRNRGSRGIQFPRDRCGR